MLSVAESSRASAITPRRRYARIPEVLEIPNLIEMDKLSFKGIPPLRFPKGARPEDLAVEENHVSWAHMYRMMFVAQVGFALAYLL